MRQILYVWNYREWGGAQIYFMSLMKEAKSSYRVTALIPADSEPKISQYLTSLEIPWEFLPPSTALGQSTGLIAKISRRLKFLRSETPLVRNILAREALADTIVHVDLGFWQSFLTLLRLSRKTNVFLTVHTGLPLYTGWRGLRWKIKGKALSRFSSFHLLASNREAKESLKPYITYDKYEQTEVTYSGFDPAEIAVVAEDRPPKATILRQHGLPENRPLVMTVGQFIERKGCWVLLESLRKIRDSGQDIAFVWLSTTPPNKETLERINGYGLGVSFRLMDADEIGETRDELLSLLSIADIFVLASLQEGLPIALIEAMALGLPCIATDVNAVPEAIENGQTGLLMPPNDPVQLRDAITALSNDPAERARLGTAGKTKAFETFNAKITAGRTVKLYNDVWKTRR